MIDAMFRLFTDHPDLAKYWDAEDIDPEKLCKSMKFQSIGAEEMRNLFGVVMGYGQVRQPHNCINHCN